MSLEIELENVIQRVMTEFDPRSPQYHEAWAATRFIIDRARAGGLSDACIYNVFINPPKEGETHEQAPLR